MKKDGALVRLRRNWDKTIAYITVIVFLYAKNC